jgi:hypothetical protein
MRVWRWGNDIHNTGYRIFTFWYSRLLGLDCYLFHYPTGSRIPKHKDPSKYGPHYRLNFELIKAKKGGVFQCRKNIFSLWGRVHLFRADKHYHKVTPIEEGSRWVLSFGFTWKF